MDKVANNSNTNGKVGLLTLPPELLELILVHSIEANLIHVCRQLRNALPPFVPWTKSIVAMAFCLRESNAVASTPPPQYPQYGQLMHRFGHQCGIKPLTFARKAKIRSNLLASKWFKPERFFDLLSEIYRTAGDDLFIYWERRQFGDSDSLSIAPHLASQRFVRLGGRYIYLMKVDGICFALSVLYNNDPILLSIWRFDGDRYDPTVMRQLYGTLATSQVGEPRTTLFIWGLDSLWPTAPTVSDLQDILVHFILEGLIESSTEILQRLCLLNVVAEVKWAHVVLAARLGHSKILELLLFRDTWPTWDPTQVGKLADEIKRCKGQGWEGVHQVLRYELKMQKAHRQYRAQRCL